MEPYKKKVILFVILATFLIALITSLFFFSSEEIVGKIGITNAYLFLFFISLFGGFSSGGSASFIATLVTFAAGGLNPFFLGITAGIALAIGDITMLIIGLKGRELLVGKWKKQADKLSNFVNKKAHKHIPLTTYLLMSFTPLPNDLIILYLVAINYPKKKLYLPIILGSLTFATLLAILSSLGA
ncbi:MAG: hypothetical protein KKF50_02110 [Nanoarchaeota archaeon]|nr:hypothetical protein [Nanoarchaeota archaeon]